MESIYNHKEIYSVFIILKIIISFILVLYILNLNLQIQDLVIDKNKIKKNNVDSKIINKEIINTTNSFFKNETNLINVSLFENNHKSKKNNSNINETKIIIQESFIITDEELKEIQKRKDKEKEDIKIYQNFLDFPKYKNDFLIQKERKDILQKYYHNSEINKEINIKFDMNFHFGNQLTAFNKLIFYCEIIHCKRIIINPENKMYIRNNIYDNEYNMTIQIGNNENIQVDRITHLNFNFFYDFYNLKVENRFNVFKNEILNNIPKLNISENDLFIHFRSSDIFKHKDNPKHAPDYAQPPLCFYRRILDEFKFKDIYIISQDEIYNPVIKELKYEYPNVIYKENSLEIDLAYLTQGFNIVASLSSFLISAIKLNDNLNNLWEYDRYPMCLKIRHSHYTLFNIKKFCYL